MNIVLEMVKIKPQVNRELILIDNWKHKIQIININ